MFTEGCNFFCFVYFFVIFFVLFFFAQFEFLSLWSYEDWTAVLELMSKLSLALDHTHDYFCSSLTDRKLKSLQ